MGKIIKLLRRGNAGYKKIYARKLEYKKIEYKKVGDLHRRWSTRIN